MFFRKDDRHPGMDLPHNQQRWNTAPRKLFTIQHKLFHVGFITKMLLVISDLKANKDKAKSAGRNPPDRELWQNQRG
jgi:hypothetical protein